MRLIVVGKPPKEFVRQVKKWLPRLDLPVSLVYVEEMGPDMRDGEKQAETHVDLPYSRAVIYADEALAGLDWHQYDIEEIAVHELVHVMLDPLTRVADMINHQAKNTDALAELFIEECEAAATRLARSLVQASRQRQSSRRG